VYVAESIERSAKAIDFVLAAANWIIEGSLPELFTSIPGTGEPGGLTWTAGYDELVAEPLASKRSTSIISETLNPFLGTASPVGISSPVTASFRLTLLDGLTDLPRARTRFFGEIKYCSIRDWSTGCLVFEVPRFPLGVGVLGI
jgi:hypothetical protein